MMPDPTPIPCCEGKPLKYKTWADLFCPPKELKGDSGVSVTTFGECAPEEAFAKAVGLGSPELDRVKRRLQQAGLELSSDFTKIKEIATGKERPAQDVLTKLAHKEGLAGVLPQCQADPKGTVILGDDRKVTCQEVLDEIVNHLYSQGYSPTSQKDIYRRGTPTKWIEKTLAKAAQELDMKAQNLLKLFQSAVSKLKNRQQNFAKLVAGFKEGLDLQAKVGNVNPLAPIVGCYATKIQGVTLCITQDPVEIALKSTGRPWESNSCERITGVFSEGFIDDIAHHAAIAFAVRQDGTVIGRKMVRWGVNRYAEPLSPTEFELATATRQEKMPKCAGIEPVWYETGMSQAMENALDEKLVEVLQANNLAAETCTTPYGYRGYSDAMRAGDVDHITYKGFETRRKGEYLVGYLKAFYRENVPFIFRADRLTYPQINLLRQHDFEWKSRDEAAEVFFMDATYGELPYYEIRGFDDVERHFPLEEDEFEAGPLTDEEKRLVDILRPFLRGFEEGLSNLISTRLSDENVKELLQAGDMTGRTLFLGTGDYSHLFTENDVEYQGYMDDMLDNEEDQYMQIVEEKFGTTWEPH